MSETLPKIAREQAEIEINAWLDKKKVYKEAREKEGYDLNIENLVYAVMHGDLLVNLETGELTQKLLWPLDGVETLTYKFRMNDLDLKKHTKGTDSNDADERFLATASCLTGQAKQIFRMIDSVDKKIVNAILLFFM